MGSRWFVAEPWCRDETVLVAEAIVRPWQPPRTHGAHPATQHHRLLPAHPRRLRPTAPSVPELPTTSRPGRLGHRQLGVESRPRRAGRSTLFAPPLSRPFRGDMVAYGDALRFRSPW